MSVLALAKKFNKLPSDVLNIKNSYTAYCLNEASLILINAIENGEKIHFKNSEHKRHYNSFSDLYKQFK